MAPHAAAVEATLQAAGGHVPHEITDAGSRSTVLLSHAAEVEAGKGVSIPPLNFHHNGQLVSLSGNADGTLALSVHF